MARAKSSDNSLCNGQQVRNGLRILPTERFKDNGGEILGRAIQYVRADDLYELLKVHEPSKIEILSGYVRRK